MPRWPDGGRGVGSGAVRVYTRGGDDGTTGLLYLAILTAFGMDLVARAMLA